jgi:hypothetical protein
MAAQSTSSYLSSREGCESCTCFSLIPNIPNEGFLRLGLRSRVKLFLCNRWTAFGGGLRIRGRVSIPVDPKIPVPSSIPKSAMLRMGSRETLHPWKGCACNRIGLQMGSCRNGVACGVECVFCGSSGNRASGRLATGEVNHHSSDGTGVVRLVVISSPQCPYGEKPQVRFCAAGA